MLAHEIASRCGTELRALVLALSQEDQGRLGHAIVDECKSLERA
jgi:hypothetical protein